MYRLLCFLIGAAALPAAADTSLGLTGAAVSLGITQDETGDPQVNAALAVIDAAITANHGFQGGLSFAETDHGGIGALDAHLYLAPDASHKFGLFASLSDVNGRALRWATLGAEGMIAASPSTTLEARAGIGYGDEGLDFIFASAGAAHALTDAFQIEATLDLAHFDEHGLDTVSYEATLSASYNTGGPFGTYVAVTHSGLTGLDSDSTRIGLGLTVDIGATGDTSPSTRTFRSQDPVAPLIRRGLW